MIADQHAIAVVISKAIDGGEQHTSQSLLEASHQAEPRKVNRELSQREQGLWSELHNVEERLAKASQLWEALKHQKHIMHADSFQLPRNIEQYHKEVTRLEGEILSVQDELVVANALSAGSLAKQLKLYTEGVQHDSSQTQQKYVNVAYALDKAQTELKTAQSKLQSAELQAAADNSSCLELQARLQKAELALAAWDSSYAELQDKLEQTEGQSATDASYKQELQTKLEQAQGELAAGRSSVAKLQEQLQEAQQHSAEHSSSRLALSDKLQNTELRLHQAHDQVNEHLRREVQWKKDLEQASQRLSDLKGEHESLQQKLHSMEQSGVSQSKHISGLEAELLAAKEQVTDQNSDSKRMIELEAKLRAAKQELSVSASELQHQAEVAKGQLQEVQGREADLQPQLQWARKHLADRNMTILTLIQQLSEAELQLAEDRGNRAELSAKLAEAEDKLQEAEDELQEAEDELQEAVEEAAEQVMCYSDVWLSWL